MTVNTPRAKGDIAQLARLWRFVRPYRRRISAALVALLIAAGCVLALGQGLRHVIDGGFGSGDPSLLNAALAAVIGVACVLAISTFARFFLMMSAAELVIADLRQAVFSHVLSLSPAFFDASRTGEVVSRLTNDTEQLRQVIGFGLSMFLRYSLMMAGAAVLLVVTSPKLAALVLLGVPVTVIPILIAGRRVRRLSREGQDRVADVSSYVDEAVHEIRIVQAYVHEDVDRALFARTSLAARDNGIERVRIKALLIAAVMLIGFCAVGVILWIGGHAVIAGELTAGQLSAFVFYAVVVANGAGAVSEIWGEIQRAAGATERLLELLETGTEVRVPREPVRLSSRIRGEISLEAVDFSYPTRPEAPALEGLAFSVAPGERVALVGPSGAGKSTVFALLLRFYDAQGGRILLDNVDLSRCDPVEVRRQMALVPQDPVIFAGSVTENVRYGRPDASFEAVREAC